MRRGILSHKYPIGEPLREAVLCRELGISRMPLREALNRLEGEGLVEIRPNRGAVVAGVSESELLEIAEACRLIEAHLLRLAVPAIRPAQLQRAATFLDELDQIADPFRWARVNWRFHLALYEAANRPMLLELIESLRSRAERAMLILVADPARRARLNREHRSILAAVRAGKRQRAGALLDAHLAAGKEDVLREIRT